jgi:DNA-binding beta-propeller fold protein YncE
LECDVSDNISIEFTPVQGTSSGPLMVYLPIVMKNHPLPLPTATPTITPTPGPTNTPAPTATPIPRAWVSDVAVDQNSNRVFIASPRDDAVQVIDGGPDDYIQPVPVGDGPTGLAVLTSTAPSKVFVVHEPDWTPGMWLIDANALSSHSMVDQGGYVGARPVKVAVNSLTNRTYVSNYWDKLPFINAFTENMLAFVQKKSFQASYGIRTSQSTNLVYMASIDTGELIIFDAVQAEVNPNTYGACHNAPPDDDSNGDADPRNLRMVAVNHSTGHVFVTSPPDLNTGQSDSRVYVLDEAILLGPQGTNGQPPSDTTCLWNFLPNGQRSPTALPGKGWIKTIILPGTSTAGAGHIGIAANPATNKVYVTDGDANKVFVIQDGDNASLSLPVQVVNSGFDNPQGVDANPLTNKIYVANARNTLAPYGTVTVLDGDTNAVLEIVPLTGTP